MLVVVIMVAMKDVLAISSLLVFIPGTIYADSAISSLNVSSGQKYIESIQMSFPALNDSDIPAWVDEWKAPKDVQKLFPSYVSGYDFDASPVYVLECGRWETSEAIRTYKDGPEKGFELIIKYTDQFMYGIYRDGLANNGQGIGMILDYDGFAISNYATPLGFKAVLRNLAWLQQLHKVLNYVLLINTNFAAQNMIRLARPLMGNILDKCEIFGSQKYKWLPHLARKIPTNQLPPWYGGLKDWQPVRIGLEPFNSTQLKTK